MVVAAFKLSPLVNLKKLETIVEGLWKSNRTLQNVLEEYPKTHHEQELYEHNRKRRKVLPADQDGDPLSLLSTTSEPEDVSTTQSNKQIKASKSTGKREGKERKAKNHQKRSTTGANLRLIEMEKIEEQLLQRDLYLVDMPGDGDCMYKSLEHQLKITRSRDVTVKTLRKDASEFIQQNKEEFWPFLSNDDGDLLSDGEFDEYCRKVANTKTWGGQLELRALSNVLQVPIEVIQSEGTPVQIGYEEFGSKNPLVLCYFRHAYYPGEHYNSVQPICVSKEKDEEWRL